MIERYAARIAAASAAVDRRVIVGADVLDRDVSLGVPGLISSNGRCRLIRAGDRWIAVNLPRPDDLELVPAWLHGAADADPWSAIKRIVPTRPAAVLVARARLLGMAVCAVGETAETGVVSRRVGPAGVVGRRVLDLSSLWAGPLCGAVLAEAGCVVTKLESVTRRDPTGPSARLNGRKELVIADFGDRAAMRARLEDSDIVISSARPRAFAALGLDPAGWLAAAPGRIWVAITAYGWSGAEADRVGFGDDAAAAGGLVRWWEDGSPAFAGDALADPLTGLAAAAATLEAIAAGGGALIDAALARVAAEVATVEGYR